MMKRWAMFAFFTIIISATTSVMAQTPAKNFKFIHPANMDLSVKPGDNFYLYANGAWIKNNPGDKMYKPENERIRVW